VRRFLRGDKGVVKDLATRLCGSSDLYEHQGRLPISSINFVTCHDGFTLYDLFSYNEKHNLANGENNRDGCSHNLSFNCGVEGKTDDPKIQALRRKKAKNAFVILLVSQGVPMLLAGDELLHTQQGNNNGYCQDNELTWIDWNMSSNKTDMLRFVQQMIALRKRHASIMRRRFLTGKTTEGKIMPDIDWHGVELDKPLWDDSDARILAFTLAGVGDNEPDLHIIMNMSEEMVAMPLPIIPGKGWCLSVDTSYTSPDDIIAPQDQQAIAMSTYTVNSQTVVVFESRDV
jgi:glycogen operon protein